MNLSNDLERALNEGGFATGTVRDRKDGSYVKLRGGDWKRVSKDKAGGVGNRESYLEKSKETVGSLKDLIAKGGLRPGMDLGEHVKLGKDVQKQHEAGLSKLLGSLGNIAGPSGKVKARTKKLESILGKLVRKPKYKDATGLQDVTGARVIHDTIDQVKATVSALKEKYKVVDEDDYISTDKEGYRSHHLIIEDDDGLQKEIQVRTKNQDKYADWAHDAYKPTSKRQAELVEKGKKEIDAYSKAVSEHLFSIDQGKPSGKKPDCPQAVAKAVGCLD